MDTFDYKPKLNQDNGKPGVAKGGGSRLFGSPFTFSQYGQSGLAISQIFPQLAQHADDLCLLRGMHTDIPSHPQAFVQLHTGSAQFVRPSMGAWAASTDWALRTRTCPAFVTDQSRQSNLVRSITAAHFCPAVYQGTRIGAQREDVGDAGGIGNLRNPDLPTALQRKQLDLVQAMNRDLLNATQNPEVEGVIESYELAFRMQGELPKVMDLSKETPATLALYASSIGAGPSTDFGKQCLMARRFAEAGVRFIEVCHAGWDQHTNLNSKISANAAATDQPIAGLLTDLKKRAAY